MSALRIEFRESLPDRDEYFALFESTGWNGEYCLSAPELYEAIGRSWLLVTVYAECKLVGTGRIISDGICHALILDVIVWPEWQGRGIGREIMQRLMERCRAARIRDVQLFCARGQAGFYRQLGFIERPGEAPGMELRAREAAGDQRRS